MCSLNGKRLAKKMRPSSSHRRTLEKLRRSGTSLRAKASKRFGRGARLGLYFFAIEEFS
jgi:hypothetical protein